MCAGHDAMDDGLEKFQNQETLKWRCKIERDCSHISPQTTISPLHLTSEEIWAIFKDVNVDKRAASPSWEVLFAILIYFFINKSNLWAAFSPSCLSHLLLALRSLDVEIRGEIVERGELRLRPRSILLRHFHFSRFWVFPAPSSMASYTTHWCLTYLLLAAKPCNSVNDSANVDLQSYFWLASHVGSLL